MSTARPSVGARAAFFGATATPLFGTVHEARGEMVRDTGIVLCYPAMQEYRMVHWVYARLADELAAHGFNVLRFDYFGTGDSWGASSEGSLPRWESDIVAAAAHLRSVSDVRRISLVAMRLGAVLATRAVNSGLAVRDLVLWDPVVDGATYVRELDTADARVRADQPYPVPSARVEGELLGYPFSASMREDVRAIVLSDVPVRVRRIHVVTPVMRAPDGELVARARANDVTTTHVVVNDPQLYWETCDPVDTLVAHAAIKSIVAFLTDAAA